MKDKNLSYKTNANLKLKRSFICSRNVAKKLYFIYMKWGRCLILWTSVGNFQCFCYIWYLYILLKDPVQQSRITRDNIILLDHVSSTKSNIRNIRCWITTNSIKKIDIAAFIYFDTFLYGFQITNQGHFEIWFKNY